MTYFVYLPGNFDVCLSCWWFCFPELPRPPVPADEIEQSCNMWTEFQRSGIFDEVLQRRTLSTFLEALTFVSACWWFCFPEVPRPPVPADELSQHAGGFASQNYLDLQYPQMNLNNLATCGLSGIFDEVVQWRTLSTFLETLTFVSACWWSCFPELPRPPDPQMKLNNLATCGLSFSAVESSMKLCSGVLCLTSWKL